MKGSIINRIIVILLFFATYSSALAQFGISGGLSLLKSFRVPQSFFGFHVGGEIPRDDQLSFYGRLSYSLKQREQDSTATILYNETFTDSKEVKFVNAMNYVIIEGGNRYYIGNDYDNGFAGYGGSGIIIGLGKVRKVYEPQDVTGQYNWEQTHEVEPSEINEGRLFTLGGYLQGGVKYTIPAIGTIYTDVTLNYLLLANANNNTAASTEYLSPLFFNFAVGFKKDLY